MPNLLPASGGVFLADGKQGGRDDPSVRGHGDGAVRRRRFTLLDAMILLAATSVGLGLARAYAWNFLRPRVGDGVFATYWLFHVGALSPLLEAWSLSLLYLRVRPPRPARRRVARLAGTMASLSASVVIVMGGSLAVVAYLTTPASPRPTLTPWFLVFLELPLAAGAGVAAGWLVTWESGRWRTERTWIDRAGRLLGAAWIVHALAIYFLRIWRF